MLLLLVILLLLKFCRKAGKKTGKCYEFLKSKLLYGSFIRYVLLGTLKMQVSFGMKFAQGVFIDTKLEPQTTGVRIFSITMIGLLQISALFFAIVLWRNKDRLSAPPVKQKIGTLYFGLDAKKPRVGTYSVIYLCRRSLFIYMTFCLFYESLF